MSLAAAAGFVGTAVPRRWLAATPNELLLAAGAVPLDEAALRALAHRAVEAATAAGATYADARINVARSVSAGAGYGLSGWGAGLASAVGIGVRAIAGGGWGFAACPTHTPEGAVHAAQLAVARAKTAGRGAAAPFTLAPAPAVSNGRWETPVEIDPFTIPFGQIEAFVIDAATPVWHILQANRQAGMGGSAGFSRSERAFASSDGASIWQRVYHLSIWASASMPAERDPTLTVDAQVQGIPQGHYGFEGLTASDLKAKWTAIAEQVVRDSALPVREVDVGRYDAVLGAPTMAGLLAGTVGDALQLDRARGDLANGEGTTYAMPPEQILGAYRLGSPLLTVTADRSRPRAPATVAWDEDGVQPEDFALVQDGVVVDYITTRENALDLAAWYRRQGRPVRSHGCAGRTGINPPAPMLPNLALRPAKAAVSVEDLIRDTKRGVYLPEGGGSPDQQLLNVMVGGYSPIYEIANGKIVGLVKRGGLLFNTPQFWKQLDALGGAASMSASYFSNGGEGADIAPPAEVVCPPARVRQVSLINYGKEA